MLPADTDLPRLDVRERLHAREAAADGALAKYEQTVLRALEETHASLTAYAKALVKQEHVKASAAASLDAAALARGRFENGASDFLIVLDASAAPSRRRTGLRRARRRPRRRRSPCTKRWAADSGSSACTPKITPKDDNFCGRPGVCSGLPV